MKTFANHCLDRLTFGAKLNEINAFNNLGGNDDARLGAWLDEQLDWSSIDDSAFENRVANANYRTLDKTLVRQWTDHHVNNNDRDRPAEEMERLMVARALYSRRQLLESLADFWHNHFNVYLYDFYAQSSFVSWDRDVIRPPVAGHPRRPGKEDGHMLGNFRQMLELSSQHVAMNYYLDNYINEEGNPNENYAREVMELHTLGAENYIPLGDPGSIPRSNIPMPWGPNKSDVMVSIADSYVDEDVYSAMRMLTGWRVKDSDNRDSADNKDTGEPFFYAPWHDEFEKTILGHKWSNFSGSPRDIKEFFDLIAYHPGTARHIAGKLCRRFISPNPSQSVINAVADTFYQHRYAPDQLERTYRTLLTSSDFKSSNNWSTILRRPMEAIIAALRVCNTTWFPEPGDPHSWSIISFYMGRAGHRPFYRRTPDGFPQEEEPWLGSNSLLYVLRGMDWICDRDYGGEYVLPIRDLTEGAGPGALPDFSPNNLATFWLRRILGYTPNDGWEGKRVHKSMRDLMRSHPNDPSLWPSDSPLPNLNDDWPTYFHERLRGMVKLALTSPDFLYR